MGRFSFYVYLFTLLAHCRISRLIHALHVFAYFCRTVWQWNQFRTVVQLDNYVCNYIIEGPDQIVCEMTRRTWIYSLSNSQVGCGKWCVFCKSRPQFSSLCGWWPGPMSHPGGEFIFYCHVYLCLARTEYVQNYIKHTKTKWWIECKSIPILVNNY